LATTIVLGLTYAGGASVATSALTERRVALWHDALVIAGRYPATGAGFHRFEQLSPTARSDPDARWAHNEYLQVAAETGIPGLILVTSLVLWGFLALAREPVLTSKAVAAAGLAAVAIHASIDYVFHFVAIPVSAAALLGAALAHVHDPGGNWSRHDSNLDIDQRSR
jgi:O-antigen ligase